MSTNLRRNYPILLIFAFVLGFFLLVLGGQRVIAYTTDTDAVESGGQSGADYTNTVALFDDTVVHSIQVIMDEEDYQTMISTYQQTGEKDYFHADVIIDGVRIENVGIRLKGNASLQTALGGMVAGMGRQAQEAVPGQLPGNFDPQNLPQGAGPQNMPEGFDLNNLPEGFDPNNLPEGFGAPNDRPGNSGQDTGQGAAPVQPGELPQGMQAFVPQGGLAGFSQQSGEVKIPFLIKFDEYVSGQTYQGYTKLALRTYGITYDEAMLEEPTTNYVFQLMGLPATETAYTGLQVNGEAETLYVISEVVDDAVYLDRYFANPDGVLYKAEVGSSLTYVDDNPSSYARSFSQETRLNDADMAPLIEFMRFLTQSDDAAFESGLPNYLDVDSFAAYLAVTNLLVNNDSIAGMNNNYYLYYDDEAGRFTLLYWDGNESLGGLGMGASASQDLYFQNVGTMGRVGGGQNILLERFLAAPPFLALYEEKLEQVYQQAFLSGAITAKVEEYSALIHSVNDGRGLVAIEAYEQSVANILAFINQRMEYVTSSGFMDQ